MKYAATVACISLLPGLAHDATFSFAEDGGSNVDTASLATFTLEATGPGTIMDLSVIIAFQNLHRTDVAVPNTLAWGDLNITISKDRRSARLFKSSLNPGEIQTLYVRVDDDATLNELLARSPCGAV